MKTFILDGTQLQERNTAHSYLQEKLEFPTYYGKNLDALYDCLTEMDQVSIEIYLPEKISHYLERILRVFQRAASSKQGITIFYK